MSSVYETTIVSRTLRPAAQRATGLGDLDDRVGDLGDLRLGRAVRERDLGIDAGLGEEPAGELRVLGLHPHPVGRSFTDSAGLSPATASTIRIGRAVAFE